MATRSTSRAIAGSYAAMREALDTAWQAPGVDNVVNDLVIAP